MAEPGALENEKPHHYAPAHWPLPIKLLCWISRALAFLEGVGIAACLIAVVLLACWQCVDRNLTQRHLWSLHVPGWTDGVIRHSVFMLGFLGGAYATYTGRHIRIDAVTRILPTRRRMALRILSTVAALVIVVLFAYAAWGFYGATLAEQGEAAQEGQIFTSWRGAFIVFVGYVTIAFHFLVQIVLDAAWLISGGEPPPEWVAEAAH